MKIKEALRMVMPTHLETLVRMLGIQDEELLHQANHLFTYGEVKEWLKPVIVFVQREYGIRLHLRSHENLSHPAELEALTVVGRTNNKDEAFRLELTVKAVCIICPGLFLSQNDETATRFDSYSMASHIANRKLPVTLFYQMLSGLGEPEGIRAQKVWNKALAVVQEVEVELSPEKQAFAENSRAYYMFLNAAFGGYSKVADKTEFGIKVVKHSSGGERNVLNMLGYRDEVLSLEIREEGFFAEFGFASIRSEQSRFSASEMARATSQSGDPTLYKQQLQKVLCALHALTQSCPGAEKTRRQILLTMNVGVRHVEATKSATGN